MKNDFDRKILITGGHGLVGSQFNPMQLLKNGETYHRIASKDCELREKGETENLFKHGWHTVIHCAAKVGGLMGNMNHKGEFFYDNIMMNTNVIESCRKYDVKRLVVFLSTCVFPDNVEYPLTEKKIHLGPPHNSNDAYAYAKRMAEVQVRAYREQYGLNYTCVIPTNIYGPNDNFDIENGHVIPSLIHKCYLAQLTNEPFYVWGSGKPLREFIHSEDVANLTKLLLDCGYDQDEPIILSTSEEISIKVVVETIVEAFEFKGQVIWMSDKPDGQYRKPSNNAKLKALFPHYQFKPFKEGIKETVEWFIKNYHSVRGTNFVEFENKIKI